MFRSWGLKLALAIILVSFILFQVQASDGRFQTHGNFDQVVLQSEQPSFIKFFAPWCGHCKSLAPEYELVATEFKDEEITIGEVDVTDNEQLASKFGVRGLPTIVYIHKDNMNNYEGDRTAEAMISFIRKRMGPPALALSTAEELNAFLEKGKESPVVVGYFGEENGATQDQYLVFASNELELEFGIVTDTTLLADQTVPSVVVYRPFDEPSVIENADTLLDVTLLSGQIYSSTLQDVDVLNPSLFPRYIAAPEAFGLLVFDFSDSEKDQMIEDLESAAQATSGKFRWIYGDSNEIGPIVSRFGATGEKFPTAISWYTGADGNVEVVAFDEESTFSISSLNTWAESILDGSVAPFRKSEPIPETNDEPVQVIVAKTFDDLVVNRKGNVLLEFYAPWCGHCKSLEPIYNKVGEAFQDQEDVLIAKIDATANFVDPKYGIQGFPTLYWFGQDAESFVNYDGERTEEAISSFIKQQIESQKQTKDEL